MTQLGAHTAVPVPTTRWFEHDPGVLGAPFLVMDRSEGSAPADNPPYTTEGWLAEAGPDVQRRLWRSGLDVMADIHLVDWQALGLDGIPVQAPAERLEWWVDLLTWAAKDRPQPVPEAAVAWLRANVPKSDAPHTLCWGDSRIGNQLFVDGEVTATLDWEMVHVGDPLHDLSWYIWLDRHMAEGIGAERLPGFDSYDDTIARWEARTGRSAEDLAWYQVLSGLGFAAVMVRLSHLLVVFDFFEEDSDFDRTNSAVTLLAAELDRLGAR
jgi:aminoglycoside phosphotransferase (APT) family kinase protein